MLQTSFHKRKKKKESTQLFLQENTLRQSSDK